MHLLLPPSEAKSSGGRGRPLAERADGGPLAGARGQALAALARLVDSPDAASALLLPDGVVSDSLAANRSVMHSRTTPALRRYRGTVYDGLDFDTLPADLQRLAGRSIWIFSGLFGVVRGDEPVPAYRVPAKATLPGLGVMSTYWRPVLDDVMPSAVRRGLVVDLRSSDYAAMWRPGRDLAARAITVRVLSPAPRGGHAVISYNSKLAKGRLAAALLARDTRTGVSSVEDVLASWADCGGVDGVETEPGRLDLYTA